MSRPTCLKKSDHCNTCSHTPFPPPVLCKSFDTIMRRHQRHADDEDYCHKEANFPSHVALLAIFSRLLSVSVTFGGVSDCPNVRYVRPCQIANIDYISVCSMDEFILRDVRRRPAQEANGFGVLPRCYRINEAALPGDVRASERDLHEVPLGAHEC